MVLILLLCLLLGISAWIVLKKWYNPVTVFSFMWAIIIFLYLLKILPYYDISAVTQCVLLLQMIGFAVGGIAGSLSRTHFRLSGTKLHERTSLRIGFVYLMCAISILVLLGDTVEIIKSLQSGMSFDDIAEEGLITENETTGMMVLVKIFIMFPTVHCIPAIAAAELFFGKSKHRWILTGFSAALSILYALQHGARYTLILLVAANVIAFAASGAQKGLSKKTRFLVALGCALAIWFAFWLSASRGIDDIWLSLYRYFAGIPALMDKWIQTAAESDGFTYGATATWGITYPFVILLKGVGVISKTPSVLSAAYANIVGPETPVSIGYGVGLNAHVGPAYAFFCDGGYVLVLLGMALYGYICGRTYRWAQEKSDTKSRAVFLFWISLVIYSFVRFPFTSYNFGMALLVIYFAYSGKRRTKT